MSLVSTLVAFCLHDNRDGLRLGRADWSPVQTVISWLQDPEETTPFHLGSRSLNLRLSFLIYDTEKLNKVICEVLSRPDSLWF